MSPEESQTASNWHEDVFFGIHYDLHAKAEDTELGRELTPEHLRERLQRIRPDWIQCDCKGHPGYTSWPTEVGSTSPGVVKDSMRIHRDVTAELGIRLGMHYSGVIDQRAIELHPEWGAVNAAGEASPRSTCRLSDYVDELLIPQMLELVDQYDVDGFWVDGENWGSAPCWCARCKQEFVARTGIEDIPAKPEDAYWEDWLAFHREIFVEYVTKYADAVHARKADCLICSNWMYTIRQPDPVVAQVDYLSGDYTPNWGAARAALEGRFLDGRGMTWDLMVWGFTRNYAASASAWAMKPAIHLCQEVSEVVALGGAIMVYAKPQRTGWLNHWDHEIIADVADFCRDRKDVCFESRSVPEAAILHLASHYYSQNDPLFNYGKAAEPVEGALNLLLETHRSADILTEEAALDRLSSYKLVVVPEQTRLSEEIITELVAYAEAGGQIIMTGVHLSRDYPVLVGATPSGGEITDTTALPVAEELVQLSGPWQAVIPAEDTETWGWRCRDLDLEKDGTSESIVTCRQLGKGRIIAIHGPLGRNYLQTHFPRIRAWFDQLVERMDIPWDVTIEGPRCLELIVRQKWGDLMVNLINRGAGETLAPNRMIIEELPPVTDVVVRVRREEPPADVYLMPHKRPLEWTFDDEADTIEVRVPEVAIHEIMVVEPGV